MERNAKRTKRLIEYGRVSRVGGRQGDSFQSPEQQHEAVIHIVALTPGASIVERIMELDESGGTMDRPGVQRAIAMVDAGQADGIVCAYLDRWARTHEALATIERWTEEGKTFLTAREKFDTSTSTGKFALGMMLLVAKLYRDQSTEKWDEATSNAIARGVHTVIPFGYRRADGNGKAHPDGGTRGAGLVPVEPAASVVRRIYSMRLDGLGITAIANALNADEVPAPRSALWTRQTVRAVIRNRAYVGEASYGDHVHPGAHDALVSEPDWERAQPNAREPRTHSGNASLLVGLVRCGGCGYAMGAGSNGRGLRRFGCNRHHGTMDCPNPTTAPVEPLEAMVERAFLERHGDAQVMQASADDPAVASTRAAAERLRAEFVTWRDDTEMRNALGDADYRAGLLGRKTKLDAAADAHEEAVRASEATGLTVDSSEYRSWPVEQRRAVLKTALDHVLIHRAASTRTPLVERVEFVWTSERDAA